MKIIIKELIDGDEEQVVIKCHQITTEIQNLISYFKTPDILIGYYGKEIHRINKIEISFIETVDNKTFICCDSKVYESKNKLYELEELLIGNDFLQVSKSVIMNLSKIKKIIPYLSGRFQAVLMNDLNVIISRQYINDLKKKLGI